MALLPPPHSTTTTSPSQSFVQRLYPLPVEILTPLGLQLAQLRPASAQHCFAAAAAVAMGGPKQDVYVLPLTDSGAPDVSGSYIYLPPPDPQNPYIIRFQIGGASSICRHGSLWCNIPGEGETFERSNYKEYKLKPDFNKSMEIDFPVHQAGAFAYYITYAPVPDFSTERVPEPAPVQTPLHYIDICPNLTLQGQRFPLDALSICSVLSKFMGSNPDDWNKHLQGIGQRGYNMVHFTPLVMRGDSNSPYSIFDQCKFDPTYFPNGEADVQNLIERMEKDYGLMGLTDVVWNHTANSSAWLQEHPEAGYNCVTAPHLQPAYELDTALLDFGDKLAEQGYPTTINSQDDLLRIMDGVKSKVLPSVKLWEFYTIAVESNVKDIVLSWKDGKARFPDDGAGVEGAQGWGLKQKADWLIDHALTGSDRMGERFRRRVDPQVGAALCEVLFGRFDSSSSDEQVAHGTFWKLLDECNLQFYREYDTDCGEITEQLFNRIKYVRLDGHGPRLGPIDAKNPLIETYFTRLPKNEVTAKHDERALAVVNNGWVWAADAMKDHAGPESRAYLRREVIVWGDCVKLRYGRKPEDNPWLWGHMKDYTCLMAKYFKAFRIDNCHSTPIELAEYMLDCARQMNPDLAVFAELFTGSEEMDFRFCKRLGISSLIREAMNGHDPKDESRLLYSYGVGKPVGS
ncbi:MAG: hypothetical protein INR71_04730, partial [Terriglobus roseus]|nr:hypothetical protein [Terriglobus roseus]